MEQVEMPLLARIDGPSVVPTSLVKRARTYREAVRMCWALRRIKHMNQRHLASVTGLRIQFISDWLNADDAPKRRDLPAKDIGVFEDACGNTFCSQWVAAQSKLTVLEEMQAQQRAA